MCKTVEQKKSELFIKTGHELLEPANQYCKPCEGNKRQECIDYMIDEGAHNIDVEYQKSGMSINKWIDHYVKRNKKIVVKAAKVHKPKYDIGLGDYACIHIELRSVTFVLYIWTKENMWRCRVK